MAAIGISTEGPKWTVPAAAVERRSEGPGPDSVKSSTSSQWVVPSWPMDRMSSPSPRRQHGGERRDERLSRQPVAAPKGLRARTVACSATVRPPRVSTVTRGSRATPGSGASPGGVWSIPARIQ